MSRIQICHWYCVMTDRTLVVDTTKNWFGDDLTYYATLSLPRLLRLKRIHHGVVCESYGVSQRLSGIKKRRDSSERVV